jgi:hypothetical protein
MLSQFVHATASSVAGITQYDGRELSFRVGPSHEFFELSISIVFDFLSVVAIVAAEAFDLPRDPIQREWEAFEKVRRSLK